MTFTDFTGFQDGELKPLYKEIVGNIYETVKNVSDQLEPEDPRLKELKEFVDKRIENCDYSSAKQLKQTTDVLFKFLDTDKAYKLLFFKWFNEAPRNIRIKAGEYRYLKKKGGI